MADDLFTMAAKTPSNVPELSVSELAFSLKRTLEETYGRVRVRGELSKVKIHTSGHLYSDLKDADACMALVCWKATVARLQIRPEEGLEVIVTGRVSTYPQRSNYQLIVESMELAGEGALLKMLEDRKKRLAGEGLFDKARKRPLPFLPDVIGVVTSPTGAVIRDILHRLEDRFPRHVLLWPVLVQGPGAADQVAAAIRGFDAIRPGGRVPRPDLLIVARGGGSLEDLMAFNEEQVVRAAADCRIPLISAVGHETDVTLIDHAADIRAPTPTAAAEMAVPVRANLYAQILEDERRLAGAAMRMIAALRERAHGLGARIGDPQRLLELRSQRLDSAGQSLSSRFLLRVGGAEGQLTRLAGRLPHPRQRIEQQALRLSAQAGRLRDLHARGIETRHAALARVSGQLRSPAQMIADQGDRLRALSERLAATGHADRLFRRQSLELSHLAARVRLPPGLVPDRARSLAQVTIRLQRAGSVEALLHKPTITLDHASRMLNSLSYENVIRRGFALVRDADGQPVTHATALHRGDAIRLHFRDGDVGARVETTE